MKKVLALMFALLIWLASGAAAQERTAAEGAVWQLNYMKIKSGKSAEFIKWSREYRVPMLEEWKKRGIILDYKFFTQPTRESPLDWDVMEALLVKNYRELLDFDEAKSKEVGEISLKIFGSAENRTKIIAELRDASREMVASRMIREMQFNPLK